MPDQTTETVDAIIAGDVNIAKVTEAVRQVIEASEATVLWEFHCGLCDALGKAELGDVLTPDTLTIGEQVDIVDKTGVGWDSFDPRNDQRYAQAMLVAVALHRLPALGGDRVRALALVNEVTTGEFDAAYRIVEKRPVDPTSPGSG